MGVWQSTRFPPRAQRRAWSRDPQQTAGALEAFCGGRIGKDALESIVFPSVCGPCWSHGQLYWRPGSSTATGALLRSGDLGSPTRVFLLSLALLQRGGLAQRKRFRPETLQVHTRHYSLGWRVRACPEPEARPTP